MPLVWWARWNEWATAKAARQAFAHSLKTDASNLAPEEVTLITWAADRE